VADKATFGPPSEISHIREHVAFDVQDEATQILPDGLLNEGLDDVMGLAGAGPADYLDIMPISA
jgi:hypothetical protein